MITDQRGCKIALVAHCLLNQNAKVKGLAQYPGIVPGLVELLFKYDFAVMQMPCPEMSSAGLKRWGQVKEQYMCRGYVKVFENDAETVLNSIADYLDEEYKLVLIGIDGSPSCGVNISESNSGWGGTMLSKEECFVENIEAPGAFIEILNQKAAARGMRQIPSIGIPLDVAGGAIDLAQLERFLSAI